MTTLDDKIEMMDKTSEEWKKIPIWVKISLYLVKTRQAALWFGVFMGGITAGILIFSSAKILGILALIFVFLYAGAVQRVDNADLWESKAEK